MNRAATRNFLTIECVNTRQRLFGGRRCRRHGRSGSYRKCVMTVYKFHIVNHSPE
jgi:hypothetical protein